MSCAMCAEGSIYDMDCVECCARLVKSARSDRAPKLARDLQAGMLLHIEHLAGAKMRAATVAALKAAA